jgi:hypothetical protein
MNPKPQLVTMHHIRKTVVNLLWIAPSTKRSWFLLDLSLQTLGFGVALLPLIPASKVGPPTTVVLVGYLLILLLALTVQWAAGQKRSGRKWTFVRFISRLVHLFIVGFVLYEALSFGFMLGWTIPSWVLSLIVIVSFGWMASIRIRPQNPRIPLILPVSLWIGACLFGWATEKDTLRCEDYIRILKQPDVLPSIPSVELPNQCQIGTRFQPVGYPRMIYPTNEINRYLVTVNFQPTHASPKQEQHIFNGGVCEVQLKENKLGRVTHCAYEKLWDLRYDSTTNQFLGAGPLGLIRSTGEVPFKILARNRTSRLPDLIGFFPSVDSTRITVFFDDFQSAEVYDSTTLNWIESKELKINPVQVHYNPHTQEGMYCFGSAHLFPINNRGYLGLAFKRDPLALRLLGDSNHVPWAWLAFSDGCDVNWEARTAYISIATLGIVAVVDYDHGTVLDILWVGFGVRSTVLNPAKNRIYTANYLNGEVLEIETTSGTVLRKWFVGRFVRDLTHDRDHAILYVTSTVGIVSIILDS